MIINNTSDLAKPISTATQAALDTKVSTATFSTTVAAKANVSDLDLKAPIDSPTFTGTVAGITKAMVGLGSVDNTSDIAKPISTLTKEALDTKVSTSVFSTTVATKANPSDLALKAPIDSPTFTGTVAGITKAMVGLGSVNNTSDLAKPISTATQEALDTKVSASTFSTTLATKVSTETFSSTVATKENAANKSTATDLGAGSTSDILFPTQKAVKTYVDGLNKTKVGLGNVDNTADLDKPLSTATILALADKPSIDVRRVAKLDEPNSFTGDQQISGNLSLSNGILNLAGGTQIQSGINSSTIIQNIPAEDLIFKTSNSFDHFLKFSKNGELIIDNVVKFEIDTVDYIFKQSYEGLIDLDSGEDLLLNSGNDIKLNANDDIFLNADDYVKLNIGNGSNKKEWFFKNDGSMSFPFGSSIFVDNEEKYFGFKNFVDGTFVINTYDSNDPEDENDNINHIWEFRENGKLLFPDGTEMGEDGIDENQNFSIWSRNGIFLLGGQTDNINLDSKSGIIAISPTFWLDENLQNTDLNSEGNIYIQTKSYIENNYEFEPFTKTWKFDINGALRFPDGTITSGNAAGTGNFGFDTRTTENGFSIITAGTVSGTSQLWEYYTDGSLTFPDGTITSGSISGTSNFGFDTRATENGFSIITAGTSSGTSQLWSYNTDGSLTFPDGTISSSNISSTSNFGFDTRSTENGFSILTGTSSGTAQLWSYNTDGSLTFPDGTIASGNISGTSNFGFDTRENESGFTIITGTSTSTSQWTFDRNGVLNLPIGGDIKIAGTSVLSNFMMEVFRVENVQSDYSFNQNHRVTGAGSIWEFELEHIPLANQIAFYINGVRARTNIYDITDNKLIINMRTYDFPPQSNYEFSIDYKY